MYHTKAFTVFLVWAFVSVSLFAQQSLQLFEYKKEIWMEKSDDFHLPFHQIAEVKIAPEVLDWRTKSFTIGDQLTIDLFDGITYQSTIDRVNIHGNGVFSLRTRIEGFEAGYMILTLNDDVVLANIRLPELGKRYSIKTNREKGATYLKEVDAQNLDHLESSEPLIPDQTPEMEVWQQEILQSAAALKNNDVAFVNVMVVYTPAARMWANSNDGSIDNTIAMAMEKAQLALDNSEMLMEMYLVYSYEEDYSEGGSSSAMLENFTVMGNGFMDDVHSYREFYSADLVSLFPMISDTAGIAWLLNSRFGIPARGFSITRVQQASSGYTHIHEMGHNMGAHHSKEANFQPGPTIWTNWSENTWSAGWRWYGNDGKLYCDLMTYSGGSFYSDGVTAELVPYFSDPYIFFMGDATGNYYDGNNARTIRELRHIIAAYGEAQPMPFISLCEAVFNCDLYFSSYGEAAWFPQGTTAWEGDFSLQSGTIADGQQSVLQTMVEGPGKIGFHWRVSSESNFDFLKVFINGKEMDRVSGFANWQRREFPVGEGLHTITWVYTKDATLSDGDDAGWVDRVTFESGNFAGEDSQLIVSFPAADAGTANMSPSAINATINTEVAQKFSLDAQAQAERILLYGALASPEGNNLIDCEPGEELNFTVKFYQENGGEPQWDTPLETYYYVPAGLILPGTGSDKDLEYKKIGITIPQTSISEGWFSVQSSHEACRFYWKNSSDDLAPAWENDLIASTLTQRPARAFQIYGTSASQDTEPEYFSIEFNIDMHEAANVEGVYNPHNHKVFLTGSFTNWAAPGEEGSIELSTPLSEFSENFEQFDDFTTDISPWTTFTYSNTESRELAEYDFEYPGMDEPFDFMVFNPENTIPPAEGLYPAHSGSKYLITKPFPGDSSKWLVSPQITFLETGVFRFFARSTHYDAPEYFHVHYSFSDTDPDDFTDINGGYPFEVLGQWEEFIFHVDYFHGIHGHIAIEYLAEDGVMLMIDDFEYTHQFEGQPLVYSATAQIPAGMHQYKYFSDAYGEGFDGGEWNEGPNRFILVDNSFPVYDSWGTVSQTLYELTLFAQPSMGGTIEGSGSYLAGAPLSLEAVPANGYAFGFWTNASGGIVSYNEIYDLVMPSADKELTANFKAISHVEDVAQQTFMIYPNPASGIVNVVAENPLGAIQITDLSGRIVYQFESDQQHLEINTQSFRQGLYLIRIQNEMGAKVEKLQVVR